MKRTKYFFSLAVALVIAGCSSDDEPANGEVTPDDNSTYYMAVNIVPAYATPGSRATTQQSGDPNSSAKYEDGTENENSVTSIRFYFFDAEGNATAVKKQSDGSYKNYYDYDYSKSNLSDDTNNDPNVEKIVEAILVINTENGDSSVPAKIFAVINPDTNILGTENLSLTNLRNKVEDYAQKAAAADVKFVMANSAYLDAGSNEMYATAIEAENLCSDETKAKEHPVVMYVERNVAKVRVSHSSTFTLTDNVYVALKDKSGNDIKIEDNQVYLKIIGWNVTATPNQAYLGKHISKGWTDTSIFTSWNWYPYCRSFWAYNDITATPNYISYKNIGTKAIDGTVAVYTNEDAGQSAETPMQRTYSTQYIVAGEIGYYDNATTPATFKTVSYAEYAGQKLVGKDNLIAAMVNYVTLYKKTTNSGTNTYEKIEPGDVKLVTATVAKSLPAGQDSHAGERCYVYLALKDNDSNDWHASSIDNDTSNPKLETNKVTEALQLARRAKFWKDGKTYYYDKIQHLNQPIANPEKVGNYGVVRNHIYDISITGITGLGTPVYDPEETIYPEKPAQDDYYIMAQINILSWRVVAFNSSLDW